MNNISNSKVYSEVYSILDLMGKDYIDKLPSEIYKLISENRDTSYSPVYDMSIDINNQNISSKALAMITYLNLTYWCTEDEKREINSILEKNEKDYNAKMEDRYDLSFLRKDRANVETQEVKEITTHSSNRFIQFFNKLKRILGIGKG